MINISNEVISTENGIIKAVCTGQYSKEVCLGITNSVFGVDWWSMDGETSSVSGLTENLKEADLLVIICDFSDESELNNCFKLNQIASEFGVWVMVFALNSKTLLQNSKDIHQSHLFATANILPIETSLAVPYLIEDNLLAPQTANLLWAMRAVIEVFGAGGLIGIDFTDVHYMFGVKGLYRLFRGHGSGNNAAEIARIELVDKIRESSPKNERILLSIFCGMKTSIEEIHDIVVGARSLLSDDNGLLVVGDIFLSADDSYDQILVSACTYG
ncbi:hypothetical protein [uncultured Shewanella sp.]|uniref:hypothetical protein n=1 Tax=uncultured Shewanella sp. TaxID=173975 RepID=UPI00262EE5CA|nr:hypothetical protein [uncultured Shewanella sp.]